MTRRVWLWCLGVTLVTGVTAGCGGRSEDRPAPAPALAASPVDPATSGTISGRVRFEGTVPDAPALSMRSDPNCTPDTGATRATVTTGTDGGLQDVFVYVKDGLGTLRFPAPSSAVVVDQRGCRYVPHVVGIQVGQPLEVLNSDPTFHNVHALPQTNREVNIGQPARSLKMTHTFTTPEVMVPFRCDVHDWMTAWVGVVDHPFFAVTRADGGFSLEGLPPGTYTVEAWHETLGTQVQTVAVGEKSTAAVTFTFRTTGV